MGMQIALMLAGAVLTETTFEWKGLCLLYTSIYGYGEIWSELR